MDETSETLIKPEGDPPRTGIKNPVINKGPVLVLICLLIVLVIMSVLTWYRETRVLGYHRNITYATHNGIDLKLDLIEPKFGHGIDRPTPVLLDIHGGGWSEGDKSEELELLKSFSEIGWLSIAINYRLAPDHIFPAQLDDCRAALKWTIEHASEYGGDPDRIVLWGTSAGGHLSLLTAATLNMDPDEIPTGGNRTELDNSYGVRCVFDMAGPADLTRLDGLLPPIRELVNMLLGADPNLERINEPLPGALEASPLTYIDLGDPPVFIVHGTVDIIIPQWQSEELYETLVEAGVEAELVIVEGLDHEGHWEQSEMAPEEIWSRILEFAVKYVGEW
ncbi:alpha/beta hydrolase [bacterium]|nr:alpha/beta hydrolase [bacterium]